MIAQIVSTRKFEGTNEKLLKSEKTELKRKQAGR